MPPTHISKLGRPDLEILRSEIDRIDDSLLALVEQRLHRSEEIGLCKLRDDPSGLPIRPARERQVICRLAARAGTIPRAAIASIWRELMGISLQSQRRTTLLVHAPLQPVAVTDCARLAFGCSAPLAAADSVEDALDRARLGRAIAIVELSPADAWWVPLVDDRRLAILQALRDRQGRALALAVGRASGVRHGYPILSEAEIRRRRDCGRRVRPLAMWRDLRLCIDEPSGQEGDGR